MMKEDGQFTESQEKIITALKGLPAAMNDKGELDSKTVKSLLGAKEVQDAFIELSLVRSDDPDPEAAGLEQDDKIEKIKQRVNKDALEALLKIKDIFATYAKEVDELAKRGANKEDLQYAESELQNIIAPMFLTKQGLELSWVVGQNPIGGEVKIGPGNSYGSQVTKKIIGDIFERLKVKEVGGKEDTDATIKNLKLTCLPVMAAAYGADGVIKQTIDYAKTDPSILDVHTARSARAFECADTTTAEGREIARKLMNAMQKPIDGRLFLPCAVAGLQGDSPSWNGFQEMVEGIEFTKQSYRTLISSPSNFFMLNTIYANAEVQTKEDIKKYITETFEKADLENSGKDFSDIKNRWQEAMGFCQGLLYGEVLFPTLGLGEVRPAESVIPTEQKDPQSQPSIFQRLWNNVRSWFAPARQESYLSSQESPQQQSEGWLSRLWRWLLPHNRNAVTPVSRDPSEASSSDPTNSPPAESLSTSSFVTVSLDPPKATEPLKRQTPSFYDRLKAFVAIGSGRTQ